MEALAHRRCVHPQERALGVAVRLCPGGQPVRHSPTRIEAAGQLLVEARGEGQGPLREPHAEPVYEGRTCPPHQRAPGAVLLRYMESSTARKTVTGAAPSSRAPSI